MQRTCYNLDVQVGNRDENSQSNFESHLGECVLVLGQVVYGQVDEAVDLVHPEEHLLGDQNRAADNVSVLPAAGSTSGRPRGGR